MNLDGPTYDALGYGVCLDRGYSGLAVKSRMPGGMARRSAEEQRETAAAIKRKQRARYGAEAVRAANRRHQAAKRARDRAA